MRRMYDETELTNTVEEVIAKDSKKYYKHTVIMTTDATQLDQDLSVIQDVTTGSDIYMSAVNSFKLSFTIINSSPDPITEYNEFKLVDNLTGNFIVEPGQGGSRAVGAVSLENTNGYPTPDDYDNEGYLLVQGVLRSSMGHVYAVNFSYDDDNIYEYTEVTDVVTEL